MKLPKNEGTLDRSVRIIIGLISLVSGVMWLTGLPQIIAFIIGALALITGLVGTCGLYMLFGFSTCPTKKS